MKENELKPLLPCPFCGGRAEMLANVWVCCTDCGAETDGVEEWNTRTRPSDETDNGLKNCCREAIEDYKVIFFCDCDSDVPPAIGKADKTEEIEELARIIGDLHWDDRNKIAREILKAGYIRKEPK